ncbi:MAG TPA: glycosyltransferase [Candidatus Thermoplasmatota archaeon]|nr:glycosyltransferase [Candidatus Thermoplasmatota archaeon]
MKVLLATLDSVRTLQGGVEWYVHRLAKALADEGHDVTVATRRGGEHDGVRYEGTRLPPLPSSHRTRLLLERPFALHVRKLAKAADVVHGQNADGMGALGVAPLVATVHTTPLDEWASSRLGGWREALYQRPIQDATVARWRRFAQRAAHVWTPGEHVARSLRELGARRVEVLPNPVPPLPRHDPREARAKLGLPEGPLVLYLGRLARVKRVDRLLEAVRQMRDTHLVIAGEGPEEAELRKAAGERVRFLGRVDEPTKAMLLQAADVLCLPSEHEGQPLVLLEAMSVGTPVVATDAAWVPPELREYGLWGDALPHLLKTAMSRKRGAAAPVMGYRETARRMSRVYEEVARR